MGGGRVIKLKPGNGMQWHGSPFPDATPHYYADLDNRLRVGFDLGDGSDTPLDATHGLVNINLSMLKDGKPELGHYVGRAGGHNWDLLPQIAETIEVAARKFDKLYTGIPWGFKVDLVYDECPKHARIYEQWLPRHGFVRVDPEPCECPDDHGLIPIMFREVRPPYANKLDRARELIANGATFKSAAEQVGLSHTYVYRQIPEYRTQVRSTEQERTEALALLRAGYNYAEAAAGVGFSEASVREWHPGYGDRNKATRLTVPQALQAERLLKDGASYEDTAETVGCSPTTLRYRFPDYGWTKAQNGAHRQRTERLDAL